MIAALWLAEMPLQALLRKKPELACEQAVVVEGALEGGVRVCAATQKARKMGVRPKMTLAQARTRCPELAVYRRDKAAESSALDALAEIAGSISPRVQRGEGQENSWVWLDVAGLEELWGPPLAIATALSVRADKLQLALCMGIARSKTLASLVAKSGSSSVVLPASQHAERRFVRDLPIGVLEPEPQVLAALSRFGVRTVGELLRLPAHNLVARLGPAASVLLRRARGEEEDGGFVPTPCAPSFREGEQLDWAIDNLEPLAFVLRGLFDKLLARLALFGYGADEILLDLVFDEGGRSTRQVRLAAPTREVRPLLELCRLALAERPPEQAVSAVEVTLVPAATRLWQLSLFEPVGPSPDKLAVTLARLQALCGEGRVGTIAPVDSYENDSFCMQPFALSNTALAEGSIVAVRTLRRMRPPVEVEVVCRGERPREISGKGRVVRSSGPYRRSAPWWGRGEPVLRDVYDVWLADGTTYRLLHEHNEVAGREQWLLEGCYD